MNILAIETSCDETAAAVVSDGRKVISEEVYSQINIHKQYGGVVPEIASRSHIQKLPLVVGSVIDGAGGLDNINAVAVTYGPGLVGALLTGISYAKGLAYAAKKPLIPINHIMGHVCANYLTFAQLKPPFLCLIISGGHTELVDVQSYAAFKVLGRTRDDAVGEAIDKTARVLGLSYPGGPNLQLLAEDGDINAFRFPKCFKGAEHFDFSFSGLKTSVINQIRKMDKEKQIYSKQDIAASFLEIIAQTLTDKTFNALKTTDYNSIAVCGGVSANKQIREKFKNLANEREIDLYFPKLEYCTDNAAMIGSAAYYIYKQGITAHYDLNARPILEIDNLCNF